MQNCELNSDPITNFCTLREQCVQGHSFVVGNKARM